MNKRHPRRTDEEWLDLIRECRSSGLSDKCWCEEHHIHTSNFYYQIRRLRNMACEIPKPVHPFPSKKQEIVQISFDSPLCEPIQKEPSVPNVPSDTAIRVMLHGFRVEITNAAAEETIFHTLSVLQRLCQETCPAYQKSM